jgi:hypothetical protein
MDGDAWGGGGSYEMGMMELEGTMGRQSIREQIGYAPEFPSVPSFPSQGPALGSAECGRDWKAMTVPPGISGSLCLTNLGTVLKCTALTPISEVQKLRHADCYWRLAFRAV